MGIGVVGGEKDARTMKKIGLESKSEDPHAQCIVGGHEFHEEPISLLSRMKQGFSFQFRGAHLASNEIDLDAVATNHALHLPNNVKQRERSALNVVVRGRNGGGGSFVQRTLPVADVVITAMRCVLPARDCLR